MKKCLIILPYFGRFNNYFDLFVESCRKNTTVEWLLLTDDRTNLKYPNNIHVIYTTIEDIKKRVNEKMGFEVALDKPYKLCDIRPAFGFIFEEELIGYDYWGHCDCDLIFGDLDNRLQLLMCEEWDKIFAVGHLSLYKNTYENNRIFMNSVDGVKIYKEFMTCPDPCWFDEDWKEYNIVRLFIDAGKRLYLDDLSANPYGQKARFHLRKYIPSVRGFVTLPYENGLFTWEDGSIFFNRIDHHKVVERREFLYLHLQRRTMINEVSTINKFFAIIPNKFIPIKSKNEIVSTPLWDKSMFGQLKKVYSAKIERGLKKVKIGGRK